MVLVGTVVEATEGLVIGRDELIAKLKARAPARPSRGDVRASVSFADRVEE
jgi:hypothetical protein